MAENHKAKAQLSERFGAFENGPFGKVILGWIELNRRVSFFGGLFVFHEEKKVLRQGKASEGPSRDWHSCG